MHPHDDFVYRRVEATGAHLKPDDAGAERPIPGDTAGI